MISPEKTRALARGKSRSGCLGGLGLVGVLVVLGTVLLLAATAIFDPWAFYLGGKFHITPYWKGWGKLHGKSGDYLLYVLIQPDPRSSGAVPHLDTALTGFAYLCTPHGEKFSLNLHGGMRKHLNRSTDGEAINLRMDNQTWYKTAWYGTGTYDDSPRLFFSGYWRNPKLVMDD